MSSVICKNLSYSGLSYPSSPVHGILQRYLLGLEFHPRAVMCVVSQAIYLSQLKVGEGQLPCVDCADIDSDGSLSISLNLHSVAQVWITMLTGCCQVGRGQ